MVEHVQADKFKTHCLNLMDKVHRTKKKIIIAKRDKPFVQLVPIEKDCESLFGKMKGLIRVVGDIISPLDEKWDANR